MDAEFWRFELPAALVASIRRATLIELISPVALKTVLGYLVLNYWGHRSGWPDLLVYRTNQWFLAEVKSCSDKLNENQKRWIEDNHRYLHLPFKLVQVARGGVYCQHLEEIQSRAVCWDQCGRKLEAPKFGVHPSA